jgi:predicted transcriptional regulator
MRRVVAPIVFVVLGVLATVVVMITNDQSERVVPDLVFLWVMILVGSIVSILLTRPKYIPSPAAIEILSALKEGKKNGTAIHQCLRDSGMLITRDETYDEIRDLEQRGLIEATNKLPVTYKITPNGRLLLD